MRGPVDAPPMPHASSACFFRFLSTGSGDVKKRASRSKYVSPDPIFLYRTGIIDLFMQSIRSYRDIKNKLYSILNNKRRLEFEVEIFFTFFVNAALVTFPVSRFSYSAYTANPEKACTEHVKKG